MREGRAAGQPENCQGGCNYNLQFELRRHLQLQFPTDLHTFTVLEVITRPSVTTTRSLRQLRTTPHPIHSGNNCTGVHPQNNHGLGVICRRSRPFLRREVSPRSKYCRTTDQPDLGLGQGLCDKTLPTVRFSEPEASSLNAIQSFEYK